MTLHHASGSAALACLLLLLAPAGLNAQPADDSTARVDVQAQAHYLRGVARLCGTRVNRDPVLAALWLRMAAEEGHLGAQSLLGWMAMTGTGMPRDDARAASWLLKAAERGGVAAQNNLGVLYATGTGVEQDIDQAARWFRAAAQSGAEDAARNLAELERQPGAPSVERATSTRPARHALIGAACQPGL